MIYIFKVKDGKRKIGDKCSDSQKDSTELKPILVCSRDKIKRLLSEGKIEKVEEKEIKKVKTIKK